MLRTLTLKSQLKFGHFANYTVDQIFQLEKDEYLRWVYYNSSNISFVPEILERLNITYIIAKPGVDKIWYTEEKARIFHATERPILTVAEASKYKYIGESHKKARLAQQAKMNQLSKADLMNINRTKHN